jgi:hypothetical protein
VRSALGTPARGSLTARRAARWERAQRDLEELRLGDDPAPGELDELAGRRNRISLAPPVAPTWIGDRVAATDTRVFGSYHLDLGSAWPRLWLLLPDDVRAELRTARAGFDAAATLAGWGTLYVLLGLEWWPAAVVGVCAHGAAWRRGRVAITELTELAEATVDLYGARLGTALGLTATTENTELTRELGAAIHRRLRKGT